MTLPPHPEELARASVSKDVAGSGPHGSPGDAKHRPETALKRLLTMRNYRRSAQRVERIGAEGVIRRTSHDPTAPCGPSVRLAALLFHPESLTEKGGQQFSGSF